MTQILRLDGDSQSLLRMLLQIISDTATDPMYHISEIVQNEMDADATEISIELIRQGGKKGKLQKILISGNGFGFLESFEHYSQNISTSIKKYFDKYLDRRKEGKSRGEFCIGLQGFRAICEEMHIINLTKEDMLPEAGQQIQDLNFSKMFSNRKMILSIDSIEAKIQEEHEFTDRRESHGVSCALYKPKVQIKVQNLVKYLSQNKRSELLSNRHLKIIVKDGAFQKRVKPIDYSGEKFEFTIKHPKESQGYKYKGLGELNATLWLHVEKTGSKVRLDVQKEPIIFDITSIEEFNKAPWNSGCVEGVLEYDRLTKSPLRSGVDRDPTFWPAFTEMMEVLENQANDKVKEFQEKTKSKRDIKLMKKLDQVMGNVKRELDFDTWYDKAVDKTSLGPLDYIQVFPEIANVAAFTTKRVHVRAYDAMGKPLNEKDNITFDWKVTNDLGTISPKKDGEAIFKASSKIGASSIQVTVTDRVTLNELKGEIQIAINHPPHKGPLTRVKIEPTVLTIPLGEEKEFTAIAEDDERNIIDKGVTFDWDIGIDDTNGATLNINYGESVILSPGINQGTIKLLVTANQQSKRVSDFALITVTEKKIKSERKRKPQSSGLPSLDYYPGAHEFPLRHSYLSNDGTVLNCNEGHPDYKNADANGPKFRQRYIYTLFAKELAKKEHDLNNKDYGELMLEVLSKMDRFW